MAQLQTLGEIVGFLQGDNRVTSEVGVSANLESRESSAQTDDSTEKSPSSSSEEESASSESESEMTEVVPQFALWTAPAKQSVYRCGLFLQSQRWLWGCY